LFVSVFEGNGHVEHNVENDHHKNDPSNFVLYLAIVLEHQKH